MTMNNPLLVATGIGITPFMAILDSVMIRLNMARKELDVQCNQIKINDLDCTITDQSRQSTMDTVNT